ncbi:MAG: hypothetical protein HQM16_03460 [Deltaproteobacteria bacterium]|nr:hypothetical protein [Deltaproteobacteria bacterium]
MSQVNTVAISNSQLLQGGSTGDAGIVSTIGGAMVENFDVQLADMNGEMMQIIEEKNKAMADKEQLVNCVSERDTKEVAGQKIPGYKVADDSQELNDIREIAAKYGVNTSSLITQTCADSAWFVPETLIQTIKDAVDTKLNDLNSTSELKMIRFQSLMDARKQSMMLLSNMMNADHQTKMAIIQNLKG